MYIGPIIINRLSKFLGTFIKGFSYLFYFIFKDKRFTIPEYSKAFFKGKQLYIPKIIWQTNYTNHVTLPVYVNYLFNRLMSLDWEYRYISTEARLQFIREKAPEQYLQAFEQLTDGAAQADFWRVFVLNNEGGVYMDIDAHAVWPLSWMIFPTDHELLLMSKHRFNNYFIASAPHNPHLQKTLEIIIDNIEEKKIGGGVYGLTGPKVLNQAIENESDANHRHNKYTCVQGSFTNEYFQYMDKPRGKWIHADKSKLLKN